MRAFLALDLPLEIVDYLKYVTDRLAKRVQDIRWVKPAGIHITVKFLGETDAALVMKMKETLAPIGVHHGVIEARLDAIDAFPSQRRARVIVVKLGGGIKEIQALFSEVEERLAELCSIERESREMVPHVTVGRRREAKAFPESGDMMPIEARGFVIENLVMYKSTLTSAGAIYEPIWKIKLGGRGT